MPAKAPPFTSLTNLALRDGGAEVIFATDEWFAPANDLLKYDEPVFKEGLFTDFGKWMDGWESRRKRIPGHDWCIIKLGSPGVLRGFHVDTAFFTGNNVPAVGITACYAPDLHLPSGLSGIYGVMGTCAKPNDIQAANEHLKQYDWVDVLPKSELGPGYEDTRHHYFRASYDERVVTHLRLNYYPDGGVARLRVFGEISGDPVGAKDWGITKDYAASVNGGVVLAWSDAHYGHPKNCIAPGRAKKMDEGWETARNAKRPSILDAGKEGLVSFDYARDWFILKLGERCLVDDIEVDTNHFKGNYPESIEIEGIDAPDLFSRPALEQMEIMQDGSGGQQWSPVLRRLPLGPHELRLFKKFEGGIEVSKHGGSASSPGDGQKKTYMPHLIGAITHIKVYIYPDGGISRLRVDGRSIESAGMKVPRAANVLKERIKELQDMKQAAVDTEDYKLAIALKRKLEVVEEQLKFKLAAGQSKL